MASVDEFGSLSAQIQRFEEPLDDDRAGIAGTPDMLVCREVILGGELDCRQS